MEKKFKLQADFSPSGDQPEAIAQLYQSIQSGIAQQTLLGVTGSGKTFTIANLIEKVQRPTLILAPNKTLAAQLYGEMREFFPDNAVEYFVSYYDYYQPEAYVPSSDTYIEKDASINEHIEQMRLSATKALLERPDTIIVATVSAIYGLGDPQAYLKMVLHLDRGEKMEQRFLLRRLAEMQYTRNEVELHRATYRVRGDIIDVYPAESEREGIRVELFDDEIESISIFDPLTGEIFKQVPRITIHPKSHYVTERQIILDAIEAIREELVERLEQFRRDNKLVELQRLEQRTGFDLEMMMEIGYCTGIENYSRHLSGRRPGEPPPTLFDYLPHNALLVVDESHVTIPQLGAMYRGDRSRKENLVEYGFRLPCALDNRPLRFDEFEHLSPQMIFVSATPGPYERDRSGEITEQVVRPTGLVDPEVDVRPVASQVDDLLSEIHIREQRKERVLVTTLTKRMAEDLTDYLAEHGVKVRYLHSDIDTVERVEIIRDLRLGVFDVLVGIEQVVRPTGLVDPEVDVRPVATQVDDLLSEIHVLEQRNERVLVTTLTKRMAEDLTDYLAEHGVKVRYLHSDIDTVERVEIIRDLRLGVFDVLVGINLLREGLDMPEVSLVAILDADKEGFLRSETTLIQTVGRAARNINGRAIMYADRITGSIERAIRETDRRREKQQLFNKRHGITPQGIHKAVTDILEGAYSDNRNRARRYARVAEEKSGYMELPPDLLMKKIKQLEQQMYQHARDLEFEQAAEIRDEIARIKEFSLEIHGSVISF